MGCLEMRVSKETAGPALKALIAANVHRFLPQYERLTAGHLGDPNRAGVFRDVVDGITVSTVNHITVRAPVIESRLTWELKHPLWVLNVTERRRLDEDGAFIKSAPYDINLDGDLVEAGRFCILPRELFLGALRSDGWSAAGVTIERLRWLDTPYSRDGRVASSLIRFL
jgi:hypothetical protein